MFVVVVSLREFIIYPTEQLCDKIYGGRELEGLPLVEMVCYPD